MTGDSSSSFAVGSIVAFWALLCVISSSTDCEDSQLRLQITDGFIRILKIVGTTINVISLSDDSSTVALRPTCLASCLLLKET
jgi:hypothetical protein